METPDKDQQLERPYRVLSLDGGGMRGIYTGAFLARLTDQFARIRGEVALDLGRGFDLITGTSTGETPAAPASAVYVAALTNGTNALPEPNTRPRGRLAASARCSSVSGRNTCILISPAAFSASWASASSNRDA